MTYMEKPSSGKVLLDDTVPLTAVIEASQNVQSHTVSVRRKVTSMCQQSGLRRHRTSPFLPIVAGVSGFYNDATVATSSG